MSFPALFDTSVLYGLLIAMRRAAESAGDLDGFEAFRAEIVAANRRRPTCIAILKKSGLA